jgi:hypothetical protein
MQRRVIDRHKADLISCFDWNRLVTLSHFSNCFPRFSIRANTFTPVPSVHGSRVAYYLTITHEEDIDATVMKVALCVNDETISRHVKSWTRGVVLGLSIRVNLCLNTYHIVRNTNLTVGWNVFRTFAANHLVSFSFLVERRDN